MQRSLHFVVKILAISALLWNTPAKAEMDIRKTIRSLRYVSKCIDRGVAQEASQVMSRIAGRARNDRKLSGMLSIAQAYLAAGNKNMVKAMTTKAIIHLDVNSDQLTNQFELALHLTRAGHFKRADEVLEKVARVVDHGSRLKHDIIMSRALLKTNQGERSVSKIETMLYKTQISDQEGVHVGSIGRIDLDQVVDNQVYVDAD